MRRTSCSSCGYNDLHTFLDLGLSPIADAYTVAANDLVEMHPLQLAVCTGCWLVQLLEVVDPKTLFGTGYSFYSSASAPLSDYHAAYAADVLHHYGDLCKRLTVEIGCNDGDMLRWFSGRHVGVDPATGPVEIARRRGLNVIEREFTFDVAQQIHGEYGPAGVIIANHVLAHVADVAEVLRGVATLLAVDGVAFVEVQYLPDLLTANAFDLVYHEHRNFFSLTSLEKAALRWGLHVVDARLTDRQGGSLRVELRRTRGASSIIENLRASEAWLSQRSSYDGFQGRIERIRTRLRQLLSTYADAGEIVGYGAPAKATTLLNFCGIDAQFFDTVIDTTRAKQNRFIPGTGIRIVPPDIVELEEVDTLLLLAWNYASDIMRREVEFTRNGGRWIVPIPVPMVY